MYKNEREGAGSNPVRSIGVKDFPVTRKGKATVAHADEPLHFYRPQPTYFYSEAGVTMIFSVACNWWPKYCFACDGKFCDCSCHTKPEG